MTTRTKCAIFFGDHLHGTYPTSTLRRTDWLVCDLLQCATMDDTQELRFSTDRQVSVFTAIMRALADEHDPNNVAQSPDVDDLTFVREIAYWNFPYVHPLVNRAAWFIAERRAYYEWNPRIAVQLYPDKVTPHDTYYHEDCATFRTGVYEHTVADQMRLCMNGFRRFRDHLLLPILSSRHLLHNLRVVLETRHNIQMTARVLTYQESVQQNDFHDPHPASFPLWLVWGSVTGLVGSDDDEIYANIEGIPNDQFFQLHLVFSAPKSDRV